MNPQIGFVSKKLVLLAEIDDAPGTNPEALSMLRSDLKAEATRFAGQAFDRQVGVWRERAAKSPRESAARCER